MFRYCSMPDKLKTAQQVCPERLARLLAWIHRGSWILSGLLLALLSLCYWRRFDSCAAVTVYPPWCWTIAGLLITCGGFLHRRSLVSTALVVSWLVFLLAFADEPGSLVRTWLPMPQQSASLRVISLNCAGNHKAAREVIALKPDIVLFQESPAIKDLVALADQVFGPGDHIHCGPDASIVARGNVRFVEVPRQFRENFVHARVQNEQLTVDVICLRSFPSPVRMDLWSSDCWRAYRENRTKKRRQMKRIADYLDTIPSDRFVILGGDFNAPPGDAVFRLLRPRLLDSFAAAGRGWGATFLNQWPVLRIDQIWTSPQFRTISVSARKTRFSDHRMVIGDFAFDHFGN